MIEITNIQNNITRKPLVSIIMNCFNSSKYLREAIDSVIAQSYPYWEIIFWDNQSTDESAEVFKSYCDQRMKYFYAPLHTVLGQARNLAIEQAKGEWLGFLDCDDVWLPAKLEKQVAIINNEGSELGLVYGQMLVIIDEKVQSQWSRSMAKYQTKTRFAKLPEGYIFERLLRDNFIPLVTAMVSRVAFLQAGGINPTYKQAEDFDLFVKVTNKFKTRAVQEVIVLYRVHNTNITNYQSAEGYNESIEIIKHYLPLKCATKALKWQYAKSAIRKILSMDVKGFLFVINANGGFVNIFIELINVMIYHLRNKLIRFP